MTSTKGLSAGFEFLDIEIIDHKKDTEVSNGKWKCDQCSLVFLSKEKLIEHKSKHIDTSEEALTCRYCNKTLSLSEDSKDCYANRKCNTCEYKCANCPLRFQRQSSLLNHEKTHKMFKKNKKSKFTTSKLKNMALKQKKSVKRENEDVTITPIKLKKMKTQISPIIPHTLTNDTVIDSNNCNYTGTNNNKSQETKTHSEKKQNMKTSTQGSANNSSQEHSINYKPFSCHICGDNFASGESLLEHIPSHGEDTSGFKCKHCGDKFDDIYKMQYHLATCPLAEDETNLVKNLASRLVKTPGGPPRRQGRPRKIKESPYNIPGTDKTSNINSEFELNNTNHSRPKRKKRNLAMSNLSFNEFVDSNCSEIDDNVHDETEEDPLNISDTLYESYEPVDEEKTKVHCCPFPRCDMKFSREKALLCHMRNHSDDFEDSYKCHKCDIPFDDIHSLRLHLNECTDIKEECLDKSSEPDFEEYTCTDKTYSSLHKKKGDFICSVCGKVYQSQEKLKRHHLALHGSTNFTCRVCKHVFLNQPLLDEHFILNHPLNSLYHCAICNEDFISELFLEIHADEYHKKATANQSNKPIIDWDLDGKKSLQNVAVDLKPRKRLSCISTSALNRLSNKDEKKFWCPVCFVSFDSRESMRLHFRSDHIVTTDSIYICEVCDTEKPNTDMMCYHLEMHSSNMLSVNRFSLLRTLVSGKETTLALKRLKRMTINKRMFNEINVTKEDTDPLITQVEPVSKKNVKQAQATRQNKSVSKVKTVLERRFKKKRVGYRNVKLSSDSPEDMATNFSVTLKKPCTLKIKKNSNTNNSKKSAGLRINKVELSHKQSISGKRQRKPYKVTDNRFKQRPKRNVLLNKTNNKTLLVHDTIFEGTCENSLLDTDTTAALTCPGKKTTPQFEMIHTVNDRGTDVAKDWSSSETQSDDDDLIEQVCSMCSMVFYHKKELFKHISTHI